MAFWENACCPLTSQGWVNPSPGLSPEHKCCSAPGLRTISSHLLSPSDSTKLLPIAPGYCSSRVGADQQGTPTRPPDPTGLLMVLRGCPFLSHACPPGPCWILTPSR